MIYLLILTSAVAQNGFHKTIKQDYSNAITSSII
ncbi:MAG: hypothetical protein RLZZ546_2235, partial [Bacteroidota bacterium]